MGFLKNHIEKIVFLVLAAAFGLSVLIALQAGSDAELRQRMVMPPAPAVEEMDLSHLNKMVARLTEDPPMIEVSMNAFTSSVRRECMNPDDRSLIPLDALVCPFCGFEQTAEEPLGWYDVPVRLILEWGLNPDQPQDAFQVLDGSGFTVLEQWRRGHDPMNSSDTPPHIEFLRLKDVEESTISIELRGIAQPADNIFTLQLRWRYPGDTQWSRDHFVRVDNTVESDPQRRDRFGRNNEFHAVAFRESRVERDGRFIDESFALIRSGRHTLRLFREGPRSTGRISERSATLELYMGPAWSQTVRQDETFELEGKSYMVVDIQANNVVIRPVDGEERITIRRVTAQELEQITPPEEQTDPSDIEVPMDFNLLPF